jgi:uncharacterized protein (TIGR00251 family)
MQPPTGGDDWLRTLPDGVELRVRVGPGASSAGVGGLHGGALRVRVTARPIEGAANRELLRVLAALLDVRPSALSLESGTHGRDKRVRVAGMSAEAVRSRLWPGSSVDSGGGRH